jgi:hypothetical protein
MFQAWLGLSLFVDFVANHATHGRATYGARGAATSQDGAANGPHACANGGIFLLLRHTRTPSQGQSSHSQRDRARNAKQCVKNVHGELLVWIDKCTTCVRTTMAQTRPALSRYKNLLAESVRQTTQSLKRTLVDDHFL